jgi:1-acyl-sn-glycerol-3-phosphate acyltransferase
MVAVFRSLLFSLIYYAGCLIVVPLARCAVPFGQEAVIRAARRWALWHRWCARVLLGLMTRVEGKLPEGIVLIVLKHESMYETVEILAMFERPAVVFKKELIALPLWGQTALAHGVIPIDRESGAAAVRMMLAAGKKAIADGRPIILFPEGSRIPHGERPALGAGMAGLYRLLGLPIVPIALDSGRFSPKGSFIKRGGLVTMRVGETIPPGLKREEVEARVYAAINILNI